MGNCRECGSANTSKRRPSKAPTSMNFLRSSSKWKQKRCSHCSRLRTRRRRRRNAASCNLRQRSLQYLLHSLLLKSTNPTSNLFTGPRCLWGPVYGSRSLYLRTRALWNFTDVTLADDDTNSILADDANKAIWGWWLSFRWWSSPIWAWRSSRGSARWWYRSCTEYWSWCAAELWSCWRQYMLLDH